MKDILKFLEERKLTQEEAIKILEKNMPYQYAWKIWRFTLYLWERIEQDKKGYLWKKTDTTKAVVESNNYKNIYFSQS